jgi:hypothetical protein
MTKVFEGLESSFDNEAAEAMLNLSVDRMTKISDLVRKSMYDFDLDTPEGIEKLMALIPIMDPDILKDIMTEIWPGYPTDVDAKRHRLEIKGYLKDYMDSYDQENAATQLEGEGSQEGAANPGGVEPGAEQAQAGAPSAPSGLDANTVTAQPRTNEQAQAPVVGQQPNVT